MECHGMTEMDYTRALVTSTPHASCSPATAGTVFSVLTSGLAHKR